MEHTKLFDEYHWDNIPRTNGENRKIFSKERAMWLKTMIDKDQNDQLTKSDKIKNILREIDEVLELHNF